MENVTSLTGPYGTSFTDAGGNKWTKVNGTKIHTFGEATGILTLAPAAAYTSWAILKGLNGTPGREAGKSDDPDKDGKNNLHEFAFDGYPLSAGWTYRTFRAPGTVPTVPRAFLRAKVSEVP